MRFFFIIIFLLVFKATHAHSPDLSNLMIYEQNGKTFLLMKSSLTAFEGEIDYHFSKNAYKTPEEFKQLVIKHFEKNCFIVINNDTIKFKNTQVQLGHETTLFAELVGIPQKIESYFVRNTFFKDMPQNQCELILTTGGLPQKQCILNSENNQEVKLRVENEKWVVDETTNTIFKKSNLLLGVGIFIIVCIVVVTVFNQKNISNMIRKIKTT